MRDFFEKIKDAVLPPACVCCGNFLEKTGLCNSCWNEIKWISEPKCEICGQPLEQETCNYCIGNQNYFDKAVSVIVYEGLARQMILKFKDSDFSIYSSIFAQWMNRVIQEFSDEIDLLVSVPISRKRRLKRKYNQSELLCRELRDLSKLNYEPRILKKIKETPSQKSLNRETRLKNLQNSFAIDQNFQLKNRVILLIDDVITTGATANTCAKLLKEAGAKKVYVATLARVMLEKK